MPTFAELNRYRDKDAVPPILSPKEYLEEYKGRAIVSGSTPEEALSAANRIKSAMTAKGGPIDDLPLDNPKPYGLLPLDDLPLDQPISTPTPQVSPSRTLDNSRVLDQGKPIPEDRRLPFFRSVDEIIDKGLRPVERGFELYEQYIGKPYRELMFKEDPLDTMAKRGEGLTSDRDRITHALKEVGVGMLLDPLGQVSMGMLRGSGGIRPQVRPPLVPPVMEEPIPSRFSYTPEGHPSLTELPGKVVEPTGRMVPIPQEPKSVTDLARDTQYRVPTDQPTGAFWGPGDPEYDIGMPITKDADRLARTDRLLSTEYVEPETIAPYDKTRALRSAEEIIQERYNKLPLRSAEEMIRPGVSEPGFREARYIKQGLTQSTEEAVKPLTEALKSIVKENPYKLTPSELEDIARQPAEGWSETLMKQPKQAGMADYTLDDVEGKFVNPFFRMRRSATTVLKRMGTDEGQIGTIIDYADLYSEQGTYRNFKDWEGLYQKVFPERKIKRPATNIVLRDLNAEQYFSKPEIEALLALNEYKGDISKMPAKVLQETPVTDPKIREFWQQAWQIATGRVSSNPVLREQSAIWNPITGKMKPVGTPEPFNPHIPGDDITRVKLTDATLRRIYNKHGYAAEGYEFDTWKHMFLSFVRNPENYQPGLGVDPIQKKFANLERARLIDLGLEARETNSLVGDTYKKFGYLADPIQQMLRYNLGGLKREVYMEQTPKLNEIFDRLMAKYPAGGTELEYASTALKRAQGISVREDFMRNTNLMGDLSGVFYGVALKTAAMTNVMLQPPIHAAQVGWLNAGKGLGRMLLKQIGMNPVEMERIIDQSAVNFPSFLARYTYSHNMLQKISKAANEINLFSPTDVVTRNWAAYATFPYVEKLVTQFYKNPGNKVLEKQIRQLNLNPNDVLTEMKLQSPEHWRQPWYGGEAIPQVPEHIMERAIQWVVNRNMGRTGPSSIPLWAQGDGQAKKLWVALQRQLLSNSNAVHNIITNAPTWEIGLARALRLVGGPAGGALYTMYQNLYQGKEMLEPNVSLTKAMKKLGVSDEEMAKTQAFWIKSTMNGIGTFGGTFLLGGLNFFGNPTFGHAPFLTPAPISYTEDIVRKLAEGKYGQALYQAQPLPLPPALWKDQPEQKGGISMPRPNLRLQE